MSLDFSRVFCLKSPRYSGKCYYKNSTEVEFTFNIQKKGLHDFAIKASKYKDLAEAFDKSGLHWHKGFAQMRDSGRGVKLPQILEIIKDGIEFTSDGRKAIILATSKLATFKVNGREYTWPPDQDLNNIENDLQKLMEPKQSRFNFSLFPDAQAATRGPHLLGLVAIDDALRSGWNSGKLILQNFVNDFMAANTKFARYTSSSILHCSSSPLGSFSLHVVKDGVSGEQIMAYDVEKDELKVKEKPISVEEIAKSYKNHMRYNLPQRIERNKITLNHQIKLVSEECKLHPGQSYDWWKTRLEKNVESLMHKTSIRENPASN